MDIVAVKATSASEPIMFSSDVKLRIAYSNTNMETATTWTELNVRLANAKRLARQ
jgi:hypothetical protein